MKNTSVAYQLKLQEENIQSGKRRVEVNQDSNQENLFSVNLENKKASNHVYNMDSHIVTQQESSTLSNQSLDQANNQISSPLTSFITSNVILSQNHLHYGDIFSNPKKKKDSEKDDGRNIRLNHRGHFQHTQMFHNSLLKKDIIPYKFIYIFVTLKNKTVR